MLAVTIAPSAPAEPAKVGADYPSVRIDVRSEQPADDVNFLRGALVLRVLDGGYCVTTGEADLVMTLDHGADETMVTVAGGDDAYEHRVEGGGALAALETIHRADAGLQTSRRETMTGSKCRAGAI
ncbi:MAG: hypothetical protein AAF721_36755, partial [Myxococcota bacterium]